MVADGNRRGIRHLLPDFWEQATDHSLALPSDKPVSASAICQARARHDSDVFRDLLYALSCAQPGQVERARRWRGRRIYAADGAKINLRGAPDLEYSFGVPEGAHYPQVLMSALVDVCSRAPVDFEVSGYRGSEREHLLLMLDSVDPGDLLILDHGHPSHEILQACAAAGIDYLVRVPVSHTFAAVDKFRLSGDSEAMATLKLSSNADYN
jgi:hypothetical protein